ncbi:hypothetical protein IV203_034285 [Nitzschia inconspicua]|uniref:Uncharacterized protein n=1 Tax=Nitzschia inconspicua TaxID=303405 RepID=A0A9K3M7J2_9STRA|nr:hypothetical protein IV203_034285 [Nitzschia inconspicua]
MPRQQSVSGTFWDSPEAYKLFRPRPSDSNCLSAVERRIELLQRAQQFEGWRDLVHGRDPDNVCSNYDKLVIRQKSMFILKAYQIAILEMNRKTWLECCEIAVHEINLLGVTLTTRGDNLSRWHRLFRTREAFLHPNLEARVGRDPLPPFLRMFPDAATKIKQFCRVNLLNLNVETVHQFILNKVFPRIYAVWASEQKSRGHTLQSFLKLFRISVFSPQTTLSWMKQLGMKYANHKKSYYVDGHEREDVVTSRKLFCKRYLLDLEPRCLRWIQITKEKASELQSLSMDFGHEYMEGDINMVEFHEDYIDKAGMDLTQFEKKQSKSVNQQSAPAKSHNANHPTPDEPSGTSNDDNPAGSNSHGAQVNFVRLLPCWTLVLFVKLIVAPSGKRSSFMGVELNAPVDKRKTSEDQQPSESESSSHDKR